MGDTENGPAPVPSAAAVPVPPASSGAPLRRRIVLAVRIVAALAIGYFIVATTVQQWSAVRQTFTQLTWPTVGLSLVVGIVAVGASAFAWRYALADLGHDVPVRAAGQVFLVGQLGKYLPGTVWMYVLQMELGRRAGIPRSRAFLASLVTTGLGSMTGLVIGVIGLRTTFHAMVSGDHATLARLAFVTAVVLLPIAVVCAHPWVLTRLVGLLLRVLRREPLDRPLTWHGVLGVVGWSAVGYVGFGLHLWLLARTQATPGWRGLLLCVGAMALAISVSTFVVVAPSGIGVREFLIAITLVGFGVPFGVAYGIALASRLIATVADVLAAATAALLAVRRLHETPAGTSRARADEQRDPAGQRDSAAHGRTGAPLGGQRHGERGRGQRFEQHQD